MQHHSYSTNTFTAFINSLDLNTFQRVNGQDYFAPPAYLVQSIPTFPGKTYKVSGTFQLLLLIKTTVIPFCCIISRSEETVDSSVASLAYTAVVGAIFAPDDRSDRVLNVMWENNTTRLQSVTISYTASPDFSVRTWTFNATASPSILTFFSGTTNTRTGP